MLVDKDFLTWLLIGWQLWSQMPGFEIFVIAVNLLMGLTTIHLVSSKITTVDDFTLWRYAALRIVGLIFFCTWMRHRYFLCRQCASVFPTYVRKYWKYTLIDGEGCGVHSVCFRGGFAIKKVVGFLRENSFKNVSHVEAFYLYAILLVAE